ncbi:MAG: glycosyltransferase family 2 protein [Phycisphaerales bacterium]|nr:glycosyltransferase family 2 protein [Phycisphaerales bacterium]
MSLCVVVPAFNEEASIEPLARRLSVALDGTGEPWRVIVVDDGSRDGTLACVHRLSARDPRFGFVSLSRNFGHEAATTAGLDKADADAVVIMDADLQDQPELIPRMVERWRAGAKVVLARRRRRRGEPRWRRATASIFYRVLNGLSEWPIPPDVGDFRLMDRRVVDALRRCREEPRYMRGLFAWAGFQTETIEFDRDERAAGTGHYRLGSLVRLALDALTGFSARPLRLVLWVGLTLLAAGVVWLGALGVPALAGRTPDLASLLIACGLALTGVQVAATGIVAVYLAPVVRGTRNRPVYVVAEEQPPRAVVAGSGAAQGVIAEPKPAQAATSEAR